MVARASAPWGGACSALLPLCQQFYSWAAWLLGTDAPSYKSPTSVEGWTLAPTRRSRSWCHGLSCLSMASSTFFLDSARDVANKPDRPEPRGTRATCRCTSAVSQSTWSGFAMPCQRGRPPQAILFPQARKVFVSATEARSRIDQYRWSSRKQRAT